VRHGLKIAGLFGLLLAIGGCTASYLRPDAKTGMGDDLTISIPGQADPTAVKQAEQEHPKILAAYGGAYVAPRLRKFISEMARRLVAASPIPTQSYRVTILNSPSVNAFALPGGFLYVTRGLLALANDSSELAAVIAHEMAHVTATHAEQRAVRQAGADIVKEVVADVLTGDNSVTLETSQLTLSQFNQNQEFEADQVGIKTIAAAGYDPYASARFLQSMRRYSDFQANKTGSGSTGDFLSSHPSTPKRIEAAVLAARALAPPGSGDVGRDSYLSAINGLVFGDDPQQGYAIDREFVHPELGFEFTVPEGFTIENSRSAVLARGPGNLVIRFDAIKVKSGISLSNYIRSGWVNGLQPDSIEETKFNGHKAATASAEADGWNYRIAIIRLGSENYRFLAASNRDSAQLDQILSLTANSFDRLSLVGKVLAKPLRIKVTRVSRATTPQAASREMVGIQRRQQLFEVLNGVASATPLAAGDKIKLVAN
jgi:predicted Zn-dependent protease